MGWLFGIYGDYWKTITARYPWLNSIAERFLGRRAYTYMHIEEEELKRIEQYVEEHHVTTALHHFTIWIRAIKNAQEKQAHLAERQVFQDFHIAKATHHFVRVLEKFVEISHEKGGEFKQNVRGLVLSIVPHMKKEMKEAEQWGGIDSRTLMAIMIRAKRKGGNLVSNLRTALKSRGVISRLGRFAFSGDIRAELKEEQLLESLANRLELLETNLESGRETHEKLFNDFQGILSTADKDIIQMYKHSHLVMKRDLLLMIMLIEDEQIMEQFGADWVQKHFMPENPIDVGTIEIEELKQKLAEKAHTIANGLGVFIKKEKELDRELEVILSKTA